MPDSETATIGGSAFILVDIVANSADIVLSVSSILVPALAYLAGDLGEMIGVDQTLVTYAFAFFGIAFVLNQLRKAAVTVKDHVND